MYKVLIVDDEPIVREGLKTIIDWEHYGFRICGEAGDGYDGLVKVFSMRPELVLVDIKMPEMSGIELISEAKNRGYNGKVIILTGYSDFEYAKTSIQLGVKAYLLKPVDEDELTEILKNISVEISNEYKVQKYLNENIRHMKNRVMSKLIIDKKPMFTLTDDMRLSGINLDACSFQLALIEIDTAPEFCEAHIDSIFESTLQFSGDIDTFIIDKKIGLIFKGFKEENLQRILDKLYSDYKRGFDCNIFVAIGSRIENPDKLYVSYDEAKAILDRRFFYEDLKIAFWTHVKDDFLTQDRGTGIINTENLYTAMEVGDIERMRLFFSELKILFKQSKLSSEKIKGLCGSCLVELKEKTIMNYPEHKNVLISYELKMHDIYDKVNLRDLLDFMEKEILKLSKTVCDGCSDNTMKKLINYIHKNYYKDLKLELLAEIFNYNSSYLGKIFKNFTGENFNSYLDKIRIENAKQLLQEGLKVYQVSEKVGYKNIDYFYSKFKKHVGFSPKEYQKL